MSFKQLMTAFAASTLLLTTAACSPPEPKSAGEEAEMPVLTPANAAAGKAFLEKNGQLGGVKTTDTGLQYKVLTPGSADGAHPTGTSKVTVHYEGRHLNGEVFDSSFKRNKPIAFGLNQVIPGWTEGVQLMTEGAKYQFYIPSNLAYGNRGAGSSIEPDETLIFDVELIKIN